MSSDDSWSKIFHDHHIEQHDFKKSPFPLTSDQIKKSCQEFKKTGEKEPRILCKQDSRESRPQIFRDNGLFILPIKNGTYVIVKGEGYTDIPEIETPEKSHSSALDFVPDTSKVGNSEMQHLDYAYATSLIKSFMDDDTLVLTIRGRKYTGEFSFRAGKHDNSIDVKSVQTEVDAGYEGKKKILLVEAKNTSTKNVITRQLYYPFRQWKQKTKKSVELMFFEKRDKTYGLWMFKFDDDEDYHSIRLVRSARYVIYE